MNVCALVLQMDFHLQFWWFNKANFHLHEFHLGLFVFVCDKQPEFVADEL